MHMLEILRWLTFKLAQNLNSETAHFFRPQILRWFKIRSIQYLEMNFFEISEVCHVIEILSQFESKPSQNLSHFEPSQDTPVN